MHERTHAEGVTGQTDLGDAYVSEKCEEGSEVGITDASAQKFWPIMLGCGDKKKRIRKV